MSYEPGERITQTLEEARRPLFSKFERNAVFSAISAADLDPSDFTLAEHKRRRFMLEHTGGARFVADVWGGPFAEIMATTGDQRTRFQLGLGWERALEKWLARVRLELDTPDLWAEFQREQELLDTPPIVASDNTVFTPAEQAEIRKQLDDVRAYALNSANFTDDELGRLNTKLDELIESSRYARRFEWRDQLVGALLGAVAGNVLPQGATVEVLQMVIRSISHLLGQPNLLPP